MSNNSRVTYFPTVGGSGAGLSGNSLQEVKDWLLKHDSLTLDIVVWRREPHVVSIASIRFASTGTWTDYLEKT